MANFRVPLDYNNDVDRSIFNRSLSKRTSLDAGFVIPIYSRKLMAGERWRCDPHALIKSDPLQAPLYGTYKQRVSVFFDSDSNYYGWYDNNRRVSTAQLLQKQRHRYKFADAIGSSFRADEDYVPDLVVGRGCVADYAGVAPGFIPCDEDIVQYFDVGFFLTYLNIFRNYIANDQEDLAPYVDGVLTESSPYAYVKLTDLDDMFIALRNVQDGLDLSTYSPTSAIFNWFRSYLQSCFKKYDGGLFRSTFLPDQFVNLLNRNNAGNVKSTVVSSKQSDGSYSFNIDTFRFRNKLQRLIDRYDVSGGRFRNWLRTVWDVETRRDMDIPELISVSQAIIDPTQVTAQSASADQSLGQFGGNFDRYNRSNAISITASTPGRVMVLYELIPMVDYCQNIDRELLETKFADEYNPEFAQLGFESVPLSDYTVLPDVNANKFVETTPFTSSVGKQVAWLRHMTDYNRVHGEFSNGGLRDFWVLQRRYSKNSGVLPGLPGNDAAPFSQHATITQYVDPLEFKYPFVTRDLTEPSWNLQFALNVNTVRPLGKRFMPTLE